MDPSSTVVSAWYFAVITIKYWYFRRVDIRWVVRSPGSLTRSQATSTTATPERKTTGRCRFMTLSKGQHTIEWCYWFSWPTSQCSNMAARNRKMHKDTAAQKKQPILHYIMTNLSCCWTNRQAQLRIPLASDIDRYQSTPKTNMATAQTGSQFTSKARTET